MADLRWIVEPDETGVRLDKFLARVDRLGSRGNAVAALERGKGFVNDAEAGPQDASRRLVPGDSVRVWLDRPGSARRRIHKEARPGEFAIVFEDDVLVVVNKPPGLLAVPLERQSQALSVTDLLGAHLRSRGKRRPLVVHRIDRDTSGLVVFATRSEIQASLRAQFRQREPERIYLAIVHGHPSPSCGSWTDRLVWDRKALIQKEALPRDKRGQDARTDYRVVETLLGASLVEFKLVTGRRNQIRIQAHLHGHPLVGEQRYIEPATLLRPIRFERQALHAHQLAFRHPVSRQVVRFQASLPADMLALLARLRGPLANPATA